MIVNYKTVAEREAIKQASCAGKAKEERCLVTGKLLKGMKCQLWRDGRDDDVHRHVPVE